MKKNRVDIKSLEETIDVLVNEEPIFNNKVDMSEVLLIPGNNSYDYHLFRGRDLLRMFLNCGCQDIIDEFKKVDDIYNIQITDVKIENNYITFTVGASIERIEY